MLGIYEYIALTDNQRAEMLWTDGEFVISVPEKEHSYCLYTLYGFYVEVTLLDNQISEITPFKLGDRLDKYLPFISLTSR